MMSRETIPSAVNFHKLCLDILALDKSIRSVCIAVMEAKIVAAEFRKGVVPLLTREESELSIMQSIIRMNTRKTMEHRMGRAMYSLTEYEKILRSTIMVYDPRNRFGLGNEFLVLASLEKVGADPITVVITKILPFVNQLLQTA